MENSNLVGFILCFTIYATLLSAYFSYSGGYSRAHIWLQANGSKLREILVQGSALIIVIFSVIYACFAVGLFPEVRNQVREDILAYWGISIFLLTLSTILPITKFPLKKHLAIISEVLGFVFLGVGLLCIAKAIVTGKEWFNYNENISYLGAIGIAVTIAGAGLGIITLSRRMPQAN